ncbi:MAG: putative rRNA maturation factor, partial [Candidatus Wolfebacteria bacterium GW2011_GWC2_46_275]
DMSSDWWIKRSKKKAEEFLDIRFLLVHGVLHLFGYDHIEDGDATKMERKEIAIIKLLNK